MESFWGDFTLPNEESCEREENQSEVAVCDCVREKYNQKEGVVRDCVREENKQIEKLLYALLLVWEREEESTEDLSWGRVGEWGTEEYCFKF